MAIESMMQKESTLKYCQKTGSLSIYVLKEEKQPASQHYHQEVQTYQGEQFDSSSGGGADGGPTIHVLGRHRN